MLANVFINKRRWKIFLKKPLKMRV